MKPSLDDRVIKVRAYLTDQEFGYDHWRAAQFCAPIVAKPAVLVIWETEGEQEAFFRAMDVSRVK
jgi:hypothetical protein